MTNRFIAVSRASEEQLAPTEWLIAVALGGLKRPRRRGPRSSGLLWTAAWASRPA